MTKISFKSLCFCLLGILLNDTIHAMPIHPIIELGGYWSSQGKNQTIQIYSLVGDNFNITDGNDKNGAVGGGVFLERYPVGNAELYHGINFFYLTKTAVTGTIQQEQRYTNLSYTYNVSHYPVYLMTKMHWIPEMHPYSFVLDLGAGPNFITTGDFTEYSLDGVTAPDNAFEGHHTITFSATAGLAIQFNVMKQLPMECGYRFFYLGEGNFTKQTNQIKNTLTTGNTFGNAVMCSLSY